MHNHYFTLASPFRDLFVWLREYLEIYPPPGFPYVRATGEPPLLHEDEVTRSLGVQFHGLQGDGSDVLLFEAVAQEAHGACSLRLRCHETSITGWFWTLLERLAPARTSGQAQPLPAPPGRLLASSLTPPVTVPAAAAAATPVPAAPDTGQPEPAPSIKSPPTQPTGGQEEAAQLPQPSSSSSNSTECQDRKRGPKGHPLAERDQACEEYRQGQGDIKQFVIATKYDISARQFQRWWKDYLKRHGLT
jgi:hypothetical protein